MAAQAAAIIREKRKRDQWQKRLSVSSSESYQTRTRLDLPVLPPIQPGEVTLEQEQLNQRYSEANLRASRTTANLNVLLYVGLGTVAVGLIITFVGLGEKGFKTVQLKLIGPGLVGCGLVLTVIRIIS